MAVATKISDLEVVTTVTGTDEFVLAQVGAGTNSAITGAALKTDILGGTLTGPISNLTGDVTSVGNATTIPVSATDKLLGLSAKTGVITDFANYAGTVSGTVKAVDGAHGLTTGDTVTIANTDDYNGSVVITKIDAGNFYFTDAWTNNAGNNSAGTWTLTAGSIEEITLTLTGHITSTGSATTLGTFNAGELSAALSDASISGANTGDQTSVSGNAGSVTNGVYTTSKISALAATSSSELAGVINDETGTGVLVFATSPTLVTPALGTPSSGNLSNCSGVASDGTKLNLSGGTMSGELVCDDQLVTRPVIKDYAETLNAIGNTGGGTQSIDLTLGNVVTATQTVGATTYTFDNPSATGKACSFTFILENGASNSGTVWPGAVDWAGGTAPTLTAAGFDIFTFTTLNAGSLWYGFSAAIDIK